MRTLLVALFLCLSATSAFATPLGRTDREAVLRTLAEVIATRYVDAAKGAEMASATPESPLSGTYNRPLYETLHRNSPAWVPGRRFGETKPLFILTSKRTFSAAEALAYDLQALNRATIVGEGTGGGANPFEYRRVHPHFAVSLPEMRSINPLTGTNWQGVGVTPDVPAPAAEALATALRLALVGASQSHSTAVPNGMDRDGGGE